MVIDSSALQRNFKLIDQASVPGMHYLELQADSGDANIPYEFVCEGIRPFNDVDEPNNGEVDATAIAEGATPSA